MLKVGDVIELKKGHEVYSDIQERFVYSNCPLSKKITRTNVKVGHGYKVAGNIARELNKLAKSIQSDLDNMGLVVSDADIRSFLISKVSFAYSGDAVVVPPGEYLVYKVKTDGGATGGGMNGHDDWPDGHHVFCYKLNGDVPNKIIDVDFYQSGCFTAMIEEIDVVRKLKPKTTWR